MALLTKSTDRASRMMAIKLLFLVAGLASFLFSVYLWFNVDRLEGVFVGVWVPSLWSLGALLLAGERSR